MTKFWGVRGSIPTPLTPAQLKSKIAAVIMRVKMSDCRDNKSRERFLSRLPESVFGTIGGNTTCLEVLSKTGERIIIDAGSGIRELGMELIRQSDAPGVYHIIFTHFHWDHIQGLAFFFPLLKKGNRIIFHSPVKGFEELLKNQMRPPYFPINMHEVASQIEFKLIESDEFELCGLKLYAKNMKHPGGSISYKIIEEGKSVIFATDTEITHNEFLSTAENERFYLNSNAIILDAQYTLEESFAKLDWGHTSYSMAVDLASEWNITRLYLFHHEPIYNDRKIFSIQRNARWYDERINGKKDVNIELSKEGLVFEV